eukprot:1276465-Prorocentrum_lima.AAC.1
MVFGLGHRLLAKKPAAQEPVGRDSVYEDYRLLTHLWNVWAHLTHEGQAAVHRNSRRPCAVAL